MNKKELLTLAVSIFMTTIAWVIIELYTISSNTPSEAVAVNLKNISQYSINSKIFEVLEKKIP